MVDLIADTAPYDFMIYFKNDVHPVMANAGDRGWGIGQIGKKVAGFS
jgi:hypothetical protein